MQSTILTFDQQVQINAAKLRGAYLEMSADIEFLLVDITCLCLIRDEKERNYIKEILIASNMLSKKIDFAGSALKVYNLGYYEFAMPFFKKFKEFRDNRNKFSHTRIVGDKEEKRLDILYFTSFKNGELKDDPIIIADYYDKLKDYAMAIHDLSVFLIPRLYQERHLNRYHNILQFPSNRSNTPFLYSLSNKV